MHGTPAIVDGVAYFAGCDEVFRVVRISDGKDMGNLPIGAYTGASVAVANGRAYFGTFENEVLAVDLAAKKVAWRYAPKDRQFPFYSSAAIADGKVILGGRDKVVHAIDAATGKAVWTFPTKARVESSAAVAGGRVFIGSNDGRFYVLDLKTGKSVWEYRVGLADDRIAGRRQRRGRHRHQRRHDHRVRRVAAGPMALTATIYRVSVELAHIDRGVYETLDLRLARHPSETLDYMATRLLAYCLEYTEGIVFTDGVSSTADEPAIVVRDLTGRLTGVDRDRPAVVGTAAPRPQAGRPRRGLHPPRHHPGAGRAERPRHPSRRGHPRRRARSRLRHRAGRVARSAIDDVAVGDRRHALRRASTAATSNRSWRRTASTP